jgi:AraC-like DNA-binding protein/quercetin dioxygenase-like cupin family protein
MDKIKPTFEALNSLEDHSFLIRKFEEVAFSSPYHFHPEFELTLIEKGEGKRFVGNHMAPYREGDLVLLGPNLPHCWKTDMMKENHIYSCSIVIQFTYDFFGKTFLQKKGMEPITDLLERCHFGVLFSRKTAEVVKNNIQLLYLEKDQFKRVIAIIEILHQLGRSNDFILLNQPHFFSEKRPGERARINAVLAYIVENFKNDICLSEAANIAGLSLNAFCKYYKKITRKTFMETVIDYRINFATQLLIQTDKSISDICFDSGFNDVTHFYKIFKKKMLLSPLKYRKKFMMDVS